MDLIAGKSKAGLLDHRDVRACIRLMEGYTGTKDSLDGVVKFVEIEHDMAVI
jgi:hypothetical protein